MAEYSAITTFLGWCTVINIGLYAFSALMIVLFGRFTKRMHRLLFTLDEKTLDTLYFNFLGHYKLAIFLFNLVPYLALKIMGQPLS